MSDDALGSVALLRNAAAHAGHIKQELAAIIQVWCLYFVSEQNVKLWAETGCFWLRSLVELSTQTGFQPDSQDQLPKYAAMHHVTSTFGCLFDAAQA